MAEEIDLQEVLEVSDSLGTLGMTYEVNFSLLGPTSRNAIRVPEDLSFFHSPKVPGFVVLFPSVFLVNMVSTINSLCKA